MLRLSTREACFKGKGAHRDRGVDAAGMLLPRRGVDSGHWLAAQRTTIACDSCGVAASIDRIPACNRINGVGVVKHL